MTKIFIFKKETLNFVKSFEINNSVNCALYIGKFLLIHDKFSKTIQSYDSDGNLVCNAELFYLPILGKLIGVHGKKLFWQST